MLHDSTIRSLLEFDDDLTDDDLMRLIDSNPSIFQYIKNPSIDVIKHAIKRDSFNIYYTNQSPEIIHYAMTLDISSFVHIRFLPETWHLQVVQHSPYLCHMMETMSYDALVHLAKYEPDYFLRINWNVIVPDDIVDLYCETWPSRYKDVADSPLNISTDIRNKYIDLSKTS